jgi:uncharacterized protein (DUF1778 family)
MEKKNRGAPEKPPEDRKSTLLGIRLTAAEREMVDAAADGKASTWARDVILRAAKRQLRK